MFGDGSSHICGGTVVDERHVLTAGHCIFGQFISELVVVAGVRDLSKTSDPNRVKLPVQQAYLHEEFNGTFYLNDIALVRLAESFPLSSSFVQPIPLRAEPLSAPAACIVSGWGNTRTSPQPYPDILQALGIPFIDYDVCDKLYKNYEEGFFIPGMLCAGYLEGKKDACDGDSGGPLVCGGQLTGLVSWGEDCALPNYPGIYADIAFYKNWIEKSLGRSYEDDGLIRKK